MDDLTLPISLSIILAATIVVGVAAFWIGRRTAAREASEMRTVLVSELARTKRQNNHLEVQVARLRSAADRGRRLARRRSRAQVGQEAG